MILITLLWVLSCMICAAIGGLIGESCGSNNERTKTLKFITLNNEKVSKNFRLYLTSKEKK